MEEMRVGDPEKWVSCDSSNSMDDHNKSKIPPKFKPSSTTNTVWRAAILIIFTEFCERICYFGIISSLIIYLTKILQQDLATAAKNVNYWSGVSTLMPLVGGFVADSYLGGYSTVLLSTIIYLFGMSVLTLSWFIPSLKPCDHGHICPKPRTTHQVVFFIAIYSICIGSGCHKPALQSFGADQFDEDNPNEMKQKMSFFNWWNFAVSFGLFFGVTAIVYVQDHVSFGMADIVLTAVTVVFLVSFISGRWIYKYDVPKGSPLTPMVRVVVAAIAKRKYTLPVDSVELHQVAGQSEKMAHGRVLSHTDKFRFLDKAAVIEVPPLKKKHDNPWRLATVTEVEEVKLIINMIPIWLISLVPGIVVAQESTFFIKQATVLNRNITNGGFSIPPATIYSLTAIGMMVSVLLYEKLLVTILRRATGFRVLQRIGFGMAVSILTMVVAALVEIKRLNVAKSDPFSMMSVFWLAPQFLLSGFGNGFTLVGLQEYFYSHVPGSMRSLGFGLYLSAFGTGIFLSSFLINVMNHLTSWYQNGGRWIGKDLNGSRLDNFYWVLAGMAAVNLGVFVLLAKKKVVKEYGRGSTG